MRLFAAIPVGQPALGEIQQRLAALRELGWPVRWVREDGLHLTLKFYGQVSNERSEAIAVALRKAASGIGPLPLALAGLGTFASGRWVRVIWTGVEAPPALELLQDQVERVSQELGFELEGRPFRPHVTLGRVRDGARLASTEVEAVGEAEPMPFLANALVLFDSRPGRGGSVYTPVATMELAG